MGALLSTALLPSVAWTCAAGLLLWLLIRPAARWRLRNLRGPLGLPLLGSLLSIVSTPGGFAVWQEAMQKRHGKVHKAWLGAEPYVLISDLDVARKVLCASSQRPDSAHTFPLAGEHLALTNTGLFSLSPEVHGVKYRAARSAFESAVLSPDALKSHEPVVLRCIMRLLTSVDRHARLGQSVDMADAFSELTMNVTEFATFGLDTDSSDPVDVGGPEAFKETTLSEPESAGSHQQLHRAVHLFFKHAQSGNASAWSFPGRVMPELMPLIRCLAYALPDARWAEDTKILSSLASAVKGMIKHWKHYLGTGLSAQAVRKDDFLVKLLESGEFSDMDVAAQAFTMLVSANEAPAAAMSCVMFELARGPRHQALLHKEVDTVLQGRAPTAEDVEQLPYLCAVIDEALRLHTPGYHTTRVLSQDLTFEDGTVIPAHIPLYISLRGVMNDPSIWPRADEFLPERWLPGNEHLAPERKEAFLPFGGGARMCPGHKLALLQCGLTMASLLQRYSFVPAADQPATKWGSGLVMGPDCVWVQAQARMPAHAGAAEA